MVGYSGPHPTWLWTLVEMGHLELLWAACATGKKFWSWSGKEIVSSIKRCLLSLGRTWWKLTQNIFWWSLLHFIPVVFHLPVEDCLFSVLFLHWNIHKTAFDSHFQVSYLFMPTMYINKEQLLTYFWTVCWSGSAPLVLISVRSLPGKENEDCLCWAASLIKTLC